MKQIARLFLIVLVLFSSIAISQEKSKAELENGVNLNGTKIYSVEDDAKTLELFSGLRVADVSAGLDMAGLPGRGLVDPAIHPDSVDQKELTHQFRGIAVIARYVPTQKQDRPNSGQKFQE